jgi:hypothetical protein
MTPTAMTARATEAMSHLDLFTVRDYSRAGASLTAWLDVTFLGTPTVVGEGGLMNPDG